MKRTRLNEYLKDNPQFIQGLLNELDIEELNGMELELSLEVGLFYGRRIVYSPILNVESLDIAKLLAKRFKQPWVKIIELNSKPLAGKVITSTENLIGTEETTGSDSEVTKVSAFDSESLVDDEGRDNERESATGKEHEILKTVEETNLKNDVEVLYEQAKRSIIATLAQDIAIYLTLDTY